ncbi:MAG TPA: hypothetical protein VFM93_10670 [Candidatus Limnocylindria bacterium]|nr:hypothetical protein [Candidatus Limnocylindria bacterium]
MTVGVAVRSVEGGWVAEVTVDGTPPTRHTVRIARAEHDRYGRGDVEDLVRRSFAFLLAREPSSSILREFDLSTIERYFPDYASEIARTGGARERRRAPH